MKKYILYAFAAVSLFGMTTSCSDFGDTNVDPEHPNEGNMDLSLVFSNCQVQALGSDWDVWRNGCIYGSNMMQHTSSVNWDQGIFYTYSDGYNAAYWEALYSGDRGAIRDINDVMRNWEGKETFSNDYQFARILRAYIFHRMTDLYGDIPYSQAGNPAEYGYPKYDRQEAVYTDILKELDEAQAAIDENKTAELGAQDIYFNGDAKKWRTFANSIMLRAAMRLTNVKPDVAKEYVEKAVNNGIIMSTDDNAMLQHTDAQIGKDSAEPYAKIFCSSDPGAFFLSEYFVNLLKNTNDPRLAMIATKCADPRNGYSTEAYDYGTSVPAEQRGLPLGYDVSGGQWDLSKAPGVAGTDLVNPETGKMIDEWRGSFSVPNRYTYSDPFAPTFIVTYAENSLLLAEAALRGWVSGDANSYYENGVRAAMDQFKFFPNGDKLFKQYMTDDAISAYLQQNPLSADYETAMEQIHTQYYITTFCDEYESFANWRRTGYPVLTPVKNAGYPNTVTNEIPRRFVYPTTEQTNNTASFNEAKANQGLSGGGTDMAVRVWWDKGK